MKLFLLLFAGPSPKLTDVSPDQAQAIIDSWKQWGNSLGEAWIQAGMPFLDRIELGGNGMQQKDLPFNGYTIIQAEDMARAATAAQSHPYLANNDGTLAIDLFELMTEPVATYAKRQGLVQPTSTEGDVISPPTATQTPSSSPFPAATPEPPQTPGELTIPHESEEQELPPPPQPSDQNPTPPPS